MTLAPERRRGLRVGLWLCCLILALTVELSDARGKRHRHSYSKGQSSSSAAFGSNPLQTAVCIFVLLSAVCGSGVCWCIFLEYEPSSEQVRRIMLYVVSCITCFEFALGLTSLVHWWMLPLLVLTNVWGLLDAALRFPVVHDVDTMFTVKQVLLLVVKVLGCVFGFIDFQQTWMLMFLMFIADVCALPLLYCLALPVDEDPKQQRIAANSVEDVDIALRIGRVLINRDARKNFILGCRRRSHKATLEIARKSHVTSCMLKGVSQSYKKELRVRSV